MLTRKLWNRLSNSTTRHPLFRRGGRTGVTSDLTTELSPYLALLAFAVCAGATIVPGLLSGLVFMCFALPFLFIMFNGTVYGVYWALSIAETILREHEQGTHDLLCISPVGQLGATWLLATGRLHRRDTFHQVHGTVRGLLIIGLITLCLVAVIIVFNLAYSQTPPLPVRLQAFVTLVTTATILTGFYVDHVQSLIVGCLVGMIAPTYGSNRVEIRLWTFGVFLLLQACHYLLFWIVGMIAFGSLFDLLQMQGAVSALLLSLARLAVFFGARDIVIARLWSNLRRRLNASEYEFDLVSNLSASGG